MWYKYHMRRAAKVDDNQAEIVAALRGIGCSVQCLHSIGQGFPDILVGFNGLNLLFEIKDGKKPPSARRLTTDEIIWHDAWKGQVQVIDSIDHALRTVNWYRRNIKACAPDKADGRMP